MMTSSVLLFLLLLAPHHQATITTALIAGHAAPSLFARHHNNNKKSVAKTFQLQALVYGPDGKLVESDMEYPLSSFLFPEEQEKQEEDDPVSAMQQEMLSFLRRPEFCGPLAVLAAANGRVDVETIRDATVRDVDSNSIRLAATSCDGSDGCCVSVAIVIPFPVACSPDNFQQDVIDNLGVLHAKAKAVVDEQLAAKERTEELLAAERFKRELLRTDNVVTPAWWMPAGELSAEADTIRRLINHRHHQDDDDHRDHRRDDDYCLKELATRHHHQQQQQQADDETSSSVRMEHSLLSLSSSAVRDAAVVAIGKRGLVIRATDGRRFAEVPIRFPSGAATTPQALRKAVLDAVEGRLVEEALADLSEPRVPAKMEPPSAESAVEVTTAAAEEEAAVIPLQPTSPVDTDKKAEASRRELVEYRLELEAQQRRAGKERPELVVPELDLVEPVSSTRIQTTASSVNRNNVETRRKLMEYRFKLEAGRRTRMMDSSKSQSKLGSIAESSKLQRAIIPEGSDDRTARRNTAAKAVDRDPVRDIAFVRPLPGREQREEKKRKDRPAAATTSTVNAADLRRQLEDLQALLDAKKAHRMQTKAQALI
jgi:hypothetical protein